MNATRVPPSDPVHVAAELRDRVVAVVEDGHARTVAAARAAGRARAAWATVDPAIRVVPA